MAHADLRVGALSITGTPDTSRTLTVTWPSGTTLGTVTLDVGDNTYTATVDANVATIDVLMPSDLGGYDLELSHGVDLVAVGRLWVRSRGTDSSDDDVTVAIESAEITLSVVGGGSAVDSVNGQTGAVTLTASDVGAATSAQGGLADTAVQPAAIVNLAAVYVHDGANYAQSPGRFFVGPEDPANDGFTLADGDQWLDPT